MIADYCEGITFRYYVPNKNGVLREVDHDEECRAVEDAILKRIRQIFKNRKDLLGEIGCLEEGLEVKIYKASCLADDGSDKPKVTVETCGLGHHFVGRTTQEGDKLIMEFASKETLYSLENKNDAFEVISHEFTHVLDFIDGTKGYLPGWDKETRARYKAARLIEEKKIKAKQSPPASPMIQYALTDASEFLAVLVETFFEQPQALKDSNETLYELMKDYFKQDLLIKK